MSAKKRVQTASPPSSEKPHNGHKTWEQLHDERRHRWAHNGHLGSTKMAHMNMMAITRSPTTTQATKELAGTIIDMLDLLYDSLHTRVELDGTEVIFQTTAEKELERLREGK